MSFTYADAGVNIELGDDVSKILYNAARETWKNREGRLGELIVPFDDFSGVRAISVAGLPEGTLMNVGFDGVGTKMELAERLNDHSTIAFDLFAMVCDDAVVRGAEPVLVGSILDVNSLGKGEDSFLKEVKQLAQGYVNAARDANVAVVNGEVAELGNRVGGFGSFNYNWGAAVVWFAKQDKLITGENVKEGDSLIGFEEKGLRSNGLSLVRKILESELGAEWHEGDGKKLAELALTPSKIYSKVVGELTGGFDGEPLASLSGVAHVTGGGLPGKVGRMLKPSGLGAVVDDAFTPSDLMLYCQEVGGVSDEEAYKTWNMGQGMVVASREPDKVIRVAEKNNVNAKVIGRVVKDKAIKVTSSGFNKPNSVIEF